MGFYNGWCVLVAANALLAALPAAGATSCMVVGERSARISSNEGEKSPPFLTHSCETLRLLAGKASVSWVARDGRPHFAPVGASGPDRLPSAGAEERSGKVVWAELSTKREASRPAFMRALDEERPARVYMPVQGLAFPHKTGAQLKVFAMAGEQPTALLEATAPQTLHISRGALRLGGQYRLELTHNNQTERWRWVLLGEEETKHLDARHAEVLAADLDLEQRKVLEAMFFDQLKLKVNLGLVLASQP